MEELMEKIDKLKETLDKEDSVIRIKALNKRVQQDPNLVALLSKYHETKDDRLKQEILNNPLFREYKEQEIKLNLLILEINSKLKQITKKDKCQL